MHTTSSLLIRITALGGIILLGLSLFVGLIRITLFKRLQRPFTMWLHYILGVTGVILTVIHIVLILFDTQGWATYIGITQIFLPSFSNQDTISIALGSIALYILVFVIISGILFKKWVQFCGYISWNIIHALSALMLLCVIIHGLMVGTDSENTIVRFGYVLLFLLILLTMNKLLWRIFHAPQPDIHAPTTTISAPSQSTISGLYYVKAITEQNNAPSQWVQLTKDLVTMHGYISTPWTYTGWVDIQGVPSSIQGIPYILVSSIQPVHTG